jgi:putative holliday junction resolvase
MSNQYTNALGLDLGEKKIGVARVNSIARLPEPLTVLENNDQLTDKLRSLIGEFSIDLIVVGLPRNMSGEETEQTNFTKSLAEKLGSDLALPILYQDETLSTKRAIDYQKKTGSKAPEDALAACVILEDFIESH